MRGATPSRRSVCWLVQYFYSHAPCGARHDYVDTDGVINQISTHTPLARRDGIGAIYLGRTGYFYSHASCEARPLPTNGRLQTHRFLLSRLLRGATSMWNDALWPLRFLLTRPLRGATQTWLVRTPPRQISTHTPRRVRQLLWISISWLNNFYSHALQSATRIFMIFPDQPWFLLSHLSQGATYPNISVPSSLAFLLAGPRETQLGMDGKAILNTYISTHTPLRAQPALRRLHPEVQNFYSHASCEARQQRHRRKYLG